ncbi:hypothetical protein SFUMM280S_07484 [Streptomyces fumanus]
MMGEFQGEMIPATPSGSGTEWVYWPGAVSAARPAVWVRTEAAAYRSHPTAPLTSHVVSPSSLPFSRDSMAATSGTRASRASASRPSAVARSEGVRAHAVAVNAAAAASTAAAASASPPS